jgi:hypothetical protein
LGDEALRKFVALQKEIALIANDSRYQRIHGLRAEIIGRLTECQEIEEPVRVVHVTPPTPVQAPPQPATLPTSRLERMLRKLHLIPVR